MKPRALHEKQREKTLQKAREERERKTELERRLEPLVAQAFELYGDQGFPTPAPSATPVPDPSDRAAFAEWYERSVADDIRTGYQLSSAGADRLRVLAMSGSLGELGSFAAGDVELAVELLNAVLEASLRVENETGGGPEAVARVAEKFPGLSKEFLGKVMSLMEYYNR